MQNFRIIFLLFFTLSYSAYAQTNGLGFIYPLDREPVITGNYGELRPHHFHAGLDFSTDPIVNLPVKSVADGYVSRIKISSGGYGKVLYVTHANGYVTVYAHQKRYADKIDSYVKQKQTEQQKNEIELFPTRDELVVKQGEVIGYTGNTGSSTGPHLHFEIRDEKTEVPLNPLLYYNVKDDVKPVITHLALYNLSDTNFIKKEVVIPVKQLNGQLAVDKKVYSLTDNVFAFAFAGYDQANGSKNKNNIYEVKLNVDGRQIYHHQLNSIGFDDARYVDVFSEKDNGIKFQKCYTQCGSGKALYKQIDNGGKIVLPDTLPHVLLIEATDERGNYNSLFFTVKAKQINGYKANKTPVNAFCNKETGIKKEDVEFFIPSGALSRNCFVAAYVNKLGKTVIGDKNEPLIKSFTVSLKVVKPLVGKEDKMVVLCNDDCIGGKYEKGWIKADSKSFGLFTVSYDTVVPIIKCNIPLNKQADISTWKSIGFKVSDQLSGIGNYHMYINGTWQIAEYDAKSATITCYFNEETPKGDINIKFEVSDKVGNKALFELKTKR